MEGTEGTSQDNELHETQQPLKKQENNCSNVKEFQHNEEKVKMKETDITDGDNICQQFHPDSTGILVIGLAGSGKTTLVDTLSKHLLKREEEQTSCSINLDPGVGRLPYSSIFDIRQTINYKQLMRDTQLGPNGAILTALNLYSAHCLPQNIAEAQQFHKYITIDTPGQIEVFSWSASGTLLTRTLMNQIPTVILYVMDLSRCGDNAVSFVSNMMTCCSIFYRLQLPMVIVLNKADAGNNNRDKVLAWMNDKSLLLNELESKKTALSGISKTLAEKMKEFYTSIPIIALSSINPDAESLNQLIDYIKSAKDEFMKLQYIDIKNHPELYTIQAALESQEIQSSFNEYFKMQELNKHKKHQQYSFNVSLSYGGVSPYV